MRKSSVPVKTNCSKKSKPGIIFRTCSTRILGMLWRLKSLHTSKLFNRKISIPPPSGRVTSLIILQAAISFLKQFNSLLYLGNFQTFVRKHWTSQCKTTRMKSGSTASLNGLTIKTSTAFLRIPSHKEFHDFSFYVYKIAFCLVIDR